jgi:hypothetical protein
VCNYTFNIQLNGFFDIGKRFLKGITLADAAGKLGTSTVYPLPSSSGIKITCRIFPVYTHFGNV